MLEIKENINLNTTLKNNSTKFTRNFTSSFLNERRIRKKCVGYCDNFPSFQAKNYDCCWDCELNKNSQYPWNRKLCYLTNQQEENILASHA